MISSKHDPKKKHQKQVQSSWETWKYNFSEYNRYINWNGQIKISLNDMQERIPFEIDGEQ